MHGLEIPRFGPPEQPQLQIAAPINDVQTVALMAAMMDTDPNRSVADLVDRAQDILVQAVKAHAAVGQKMAAPIKDI